MKRCPQCEFIYPDSDKVCDFDQTNLVDATESEIAQITNTPVRPKLSDLAATHSRNFAIRKSRKALPIAAASGLILGIAIVSGYLTMQQLSNPQPDDQIGPIAINPVNAGIPTPNQTALSAKPTASVSPSAKPDPGNVPKTRAQNRSTAGPISTSTTDNNSKSQVIVLTTGNKVEADQVWRTRDGVWYRKNGMVTLLKKNQVKSIIER